MNSGNLGSIRMASTNQSPIYKKAESMFLSAEKDEDRLYWLEEMIRECPKHKSSEKMLANLKNRYRKLKEKSEKIKKSGRGGSGKHSIKKEEMQTAIVGFTNTGKSSLLSILTNTLPEIAPYQFTTKRPNIGMMSFQRANIQVVEIPAIKSEYYDKGLVNTADSLVLLVTDLEQIKELEKELIRESKKKIIAFNQKDLQDKEKRKLASTLQSKKYDFVIISAETKEGIEELKEKIFNSFGKLRVYTKEPGKEKSDKPMIFDPESTIRNVAKKVLKNLSTLKETKIWGPSSKFPGQVVGLNHLLKDLDIVEFKTR
ncbi:MAG: 50S ribosome-binding GTPase [Nanoarchaeota archaeon]|nr:50S ribosome-binding GTPase [Nanoarchaeota archaeon]